MDPEYKALLSDPKVKDITEDQEIQKLINKQDYLKLLSHPKIKSLMKDDTLLEKIARLSESLTRETPGGKTAP